MDPPKWQTTAQLGTEEAKSRQESEPTYSGALAAAYKIPNTRGGSDDSNSWKNARAQARHSLWLKPNRGIRPARNRAFGLSAGTRRDRAEIYVTGLRRSGRARDMASRLC